MRMDYFIRRGAGVVFATGTGTTGHASQGWNDSEVTGRRPLDGGAGSEDNGFIG